MQINKITTLKKRKFLQAIKGKCLQVNVKVIKAFEIHPKYMGPQRKVGDCSQL